MDLVFVYGSLKRGQSNHGLLRTARFEGEARASGLVLHDLGPFPMAIAAATALSSAGPSPDLDAPGARSDRPDRAASAPGPPDPTRAGDASPDPKAASASGSDSIALRDQQDQRQERWNRPSDRAADGAASVVEGEVFAVDGDTLERLDRLEGVPRLYQRRRLQLLDGRRAWVYLGQPRQVRHVPALPGGRWPALLVPLILLTALAPAALSAQTTLAECNSWHHSHGVSRIELGNRIGAANYLTKMHRLQESPPEAPISLYAESDLERACDSAR